ncbi:ribonuclease H-like domain-containing protein [Tanacetum coccineum]
MTGNKSYLSDYEEINGGFIAFGGDPKGGRIIGKGKISTGKLDFEDVYFVKELKFNLFSVSQMCDKKNSVLFTDTECVVLSPDFRLLDENHVLLRVPRKDNMYSVDLKNIVCSGGLTCLFEKATLDESILWHRRLGHINFKTLNKLVRENFVRGLPSKIFENDVLICVYNSYEHSSYCITLDRSASTKGDVLDGEGVLLNVTLSDSLTFLVQRIENEAKTYSINHQEDLNQQDVHDRWEELLNMMRSICEKFLQQKQAASINQSPLQEMSIQDMEDIKQHYLDEMLSLSNDLQIKD